MEIDVARVLGLVTRSVRNFEKDGKAASAVTLTRLYDTSVDDLWDAVTSRERIPRWFLPVGEISSSAEDISSRAMRAAPSRPVRRQLISRRRGSLQARSAGSTSRWRQNGARRA
ncbi:hypothetical protein GGD65_005662 [Bradyrhizobium sp. CIR18]|uniref:hypothetical protein n=1 Tax=Bradyrhizobium sp. CIR18 TaxID=2663839 RepID=UPI0017FE3F10|nr:hypothetical protein [Bradyrhizobium sp. CIR18]MBB4364602.1 hypothetical protein [Bradyrhizobium sp. CIR18]